MSCQELGLRVLELDSDSSNSVQVVSDKYALLGFYYKQLLTLSFCHVSD